MQVGSRVVGEAEARLIALTNLVPRSGLLVGALGGSVPQLEVQSGSPVRVLQPGTLEGVAPVDSRPREAEVIGRRA